MFNKNIKIDTYIIDAEDFAQPVMNYLRALVHEVCPDVEEAWKWSFPNFMYKGQILCSMAAFKHHCSFGFWKASLLETAGVLNIKDREGMGHLGKITGLQDLPSDAVLKKIIKTAMKLNEDGIKAPPKQKVDVKKELEMPEYFTLKLNEQPQVKTQFEGFSYSSKKEYIEWIVEAKTEATRNKRMNQALEWISEGKTRNWKYKNC